VVVAPALEVAGGGDAAADGVGQGVAAHRDLRVARTRIDHGRVRPVDRRAVTELHDTVLAPALEHLVRGDAAGERVAHADGGVARLVGDFSGRVTPGRGAVTQCPTGIVAPAPH